MEYAQNAECKGSEAEIARSIRLTD
jgi:hypothetical protein